jgi:hypothetical protein
MQPDAQRASEENRRPQSARYHNIPQQQRQHMPQYKLQAKITGLERSGKKDPILKFDVYVCLRARIRYLLADHLLALDKSSQVQNYSIPRHPSNTLRIREARVPFDSLQPRSPRPCGSASVHECWHGYR